MLKTVLYVQVRQDRMIVRKVGNAQAIDRAAPKPFSHPRALVGNFTNADAFLRSLVSEAKGGFALRLEILIHPLERIEGGLTEIEERAFHELALGMGASKVKVWTGAPLADAEVLEKIKE